MIQATNLCKQFEQNVKERKKNKKIEFMAVDHVSLEAKEGEIVGILGPNGAGKTTLLRMLGMLMTPTQGELTLTDTTGEVITDVTKRKQTIGYLSNNTKLYARFSIREYLAFLGDLYGYSKQEIEERTNKIFEVLDMNSFADNRIEKLSTGQTQRASIARCLMADPQLYILDEPTTGLDPNQLEDIRALIREMGKDRTVILSTHILQEVKQMCSRVIIIDHGQIKLDKSMSEIENLEETFKEATRHE